MILVMSFSLRMTFLHEPFERDEGFYAYIGQVILHGDIPYRDAIDIKPPAVFYINAVAISLFGNTSEGIRLFTACYSLFTVVAVFLCASDCRGERAGLLAALVYGIYSSAPYIHGSSSNTEVFLALPLVLSAWLFLKWLDSGKQRHLVLSGFCGAAAMLIKPVALTLVVLVSIFLCLHRSSRNNFRVLVRNQACFFAPALVLAVFVIGYFYSHDALEDFLYWTVQFTGTRYRTAGFPGPRFLTVVDYLSWELLLPILVATPTAVWLLARGRGVKSVFVVMMLPAACIAVCLPGKFFPHYFLLLLPPLAILTGIGLSILMEKVNRMNLFILFSVAFVFLCTVLHEYPLYFDFTPEEISMKKYGPVFKDSVTIARYLKAGTSPGDYIFQWGFEPELYFLAERRSPVSILSSIFVGWSEDPAEACRKMTDGIKRKKPKYIIIQPRWAKYTGEAEINEILAADYQFERKLAYASLFRRKDSLLPGRSQSGGL
jgi:4-amino-4-deoxy-L-arabinose transferase-like glycosyltransferase